MATAAKRYVRNYYEKGAISYDGSAARVLGQEGVLQPRPEVRPREQVVARPHVQVREAGRVSLFAVAGFLAIGIFAALVILSSVRLTRLSDETVSLNSQLTELCSEEKRLRARYEQSFDLAEIERRYAACGVMVRPSESQIVYLDLSEEDSVVRYTEEESVATGLRGAWQNIRSVFANVAEYFR